MSASHPDLTTVPSTGQSAGPRGLQAAVEVVTTPEGEVQHLLVTHPLNLAAEDASVVLETAETLDGPWRPDSAAFSPVEEVRIAGSKVRRTFRLTPALDRIASIYIRLSVHPAQ